MITNLFRTFDPSTSDLLSLNWTRSLIFTILMPLPFWVGASRKSVLILHLNNFIFKEFINLSTHPFANIILFNSMFFFILINNIIRLCPYVFTGSRHLRFTLSLSLPIYLGLIIYRITNFFNETIAHLTPLGTPTLLMPFIVIIESIRLIIRPLTLSIRLSANIIAGHLILNLIGSTSEISSTPMLSLLISSQTLLLILEIAVSLIQAYVFSILIVLYSNEQ